MPFAAVPVHWNLHFFTVPVEPATFIGMLAARLENAAAMDEKSAHVSSSEYSDKPAPDKLPPVAPNVVDLSAEARVFRD